MVSTNKLILILKIIYQCYIKHIMTTLRKTIMSVLKSRHILSLADNVCLDLQKCPYSIFIYRITSNFCSFGLKRRHLIFADFFPLRIENLGTGKNLFVLQEATTEAMLR